MTLQLAAATEFRAGSLVVHYQVHNPDALPALVFDRRWDADAGALDASWIDVLFDGDTALLLRGWTPPPEGVFAPEVAVPYGRRVEPGATHVTEVVVPLPLAERSLWLALQRGPLPSADDAVAAIQGCALHLGWCVLAGTDGLPEASRTPVEIEGEHLHWLDASLLGPVQQTVAVALETGPLRGLRFAGGAA